MSIGKLKRHKSLGTDKIQEQRVITEGRTIHSEITKKFYSIWNRRKCLRSGRNQ
jgi:hypothetical protein